MAGSGGGGGGGGRGRTRQGNGASNSNSTSSKPATRQRGGKRATEKENGHVATNAIDDDDDDDDFAFTTRSRPVVTTTEKADSTRNGTVDGKRRGKSIDLEDELGAATGSKRKQSYEDEDDDGFTFTRAKPKRAKTADQKATSTVKKVPDVLPVAVEEVQDEPAVSTRSQAKPGKATRTRGRTRNADKKAVPELEQSPEVPAAAAAPASSQPTQAKKRGRPPKNRVEKVVSDNEEEEEPPPPLEVKKKRPRQESPVAAPAPAPAPAPSTRTSTRKREPRQTSKTATATATATAEATEQPAQQQQEPPLPPPPSPPSSLPLHLQAQRSTTPLPPGTTKIALPFADTPIIRRNQEMRRQASAAPSSDDGGSSNGNGGRAGGRSGRRSSLNHRGRRASSLIDSGRSSAMPHDAVDSAEFFKHIQTGLPEPRRMRQLLTWCATRSLNGGSGSGSGSGTGNDNGGGGGSSSGSSYDKRKSKVIKSRDSIAGPDSHVKLAAREIQTQILKDLGVRDDMSNWFDRPEEVEAGRETVLKKPNPRNEANEKKIRQLQAELERLQVERTTWERLLQPPEKEPLLPPPPSTLPDLSKLNRSLLTDSNAAILDSLRKLQPEASAPDQASDSASISDPLTTDAATAQPPRPFPDLQQRTRDRLATATRGLEFSADRLAEAAHMLGQYRGVAARVALRVLDDAAAALDTRARHELLLGQQQLQQQQQQQQRRERSKEAGGSADAELAVDRFDAEARRDAREQAIGVRDVLRGLSRVEHR